MKVWQGSVVDSVKQGVIIQQVNAQGVMGSGIAKVIRDKWPDVWNKYTGYAGPAYTQKDSGLHLLGKILLVEVEAGLIVANVFGQQFFYRQGEPRGTRYTSYDALDKSFTNLAEVFQGLPIPMHFPLIGSDRGGGHWPIVKEIMNYRLKDFDLNLWLLPGMIEPK